MYKIKQCNETETGVKKCWKAGLLISGLVQTLPYFQSELLSSVHLGVKINIKQCTSIKCFETCAAD